MGKKNKNVIADLGAYKVIKEKGNGFEYIRLRSIADNWTLSFRSDHRMFGYWEAMAADGEYRQGASVIATMAYILTCSLLDKEFADDFFRAVEAMNARQVAGMPEPTDKEQEDARKEAQTFEEISHVTE